MILQIQCPSCQAALSIEQRFAGSQMQCPFCQQVFAVAPPPVVPVVQATRVVSAPPVQRPAGPPASGRPQPRGPQAAAKAAPKPAAQAKGMTGIIVSLVLVAGLVIGGGWYLYGMVKNYQSEDEQLDAAIKSQLEAKRAASAKAKKEEEDEKATLMASLKKLVSEQLCQGNDKVAGEILREIDAVIAEADKLMADASIDNDPSDMRAFLAEHMEGRLRANPTIYHWLGGRMSPKDFCGLLFGVQPQQQVRRERGQVADFLVAGNYAATGTGFYISNDGWLLTNEHVVHDATEVDVRGADGVIRRAQVVKTDLQGDVAVLKTGEPSPRWLPLAPQEGTMGAAVFTVGFPNATVQGVEPKFTDGRISSLSGIRDDKDHYQITVPAQPGNSGGPLVDVKSGAIVGIVSAILRGRENVTYAIKARVAASLLQSIPAFTAAQARMPAGADMETLASEVRAAIVLVLVKK